MHHFSYFLLSFLLMSAAVSPLSAQRDVGTVDLTVDLSRTLPVAVASENPELQRLAETAFAAHGRYRLARGTDAPAFTLRFSQVSGDQVRLEIMGGPGRPSHQEVVRGHSLRNALLRAADVAVARTSGLRGFFAARLTFIGERSGASEVCVSDFFFGEAQQLTQHRKHAVSPRFSPNGRKLAFTGYFRSGAPDIHIIDLANNQVTTAISFKGTNMSPRFSPDGRQLAMVLSGDGNPEIYLGNAAGKMVRRITRTSATEAGPSWSPDGSQLVFTSDAYGGPQLFVMSAAGGGAQRLPTDISGYCAEPDWNQVDPNLIAFTCRSGRGFQIAVYDRAARKSRIVTREPADAVHPMWLPDGRHILYTARAANNSRIKLLDTETGKSVFLSPASLGKCSDGHFVLP